MLSPQYVLHTFLIPNSIHLLVVGPKCLFSCQHFNNIHYTNE